MGIDYHALKFLTYARNRTRFGAVATIGRQGLHLPPWRVERILGLPAAVDYGPYCEPLLIDQFGADLVHSYDNSDYERATHIADLGRALTPTNIYDTVIDAGCLEHVYDAPQALRNLSGLTKVGGQILHILPANGFCGHGFWQFSPELFFALYSEENGYADTEVFLAELADEACWYRVKKPAHGKRAEVLTRGEAYALVRTRRVRAEATPIVQQSDYVHAWQRASRDERPPTLVERPVARVSVLRWMARLSYRQIRDKLRRRSLSRAHPCLTRVAI